jgi:hypothetical protein
MKNCDVYMGGTYHTRIGNRMLEVVVTGIMLIDGKTSIYKVRRKDRDANLPMPRMASALHVNKE